MNSPLDASNPFAKISDLPYQLPPFSEIFEEHYLPAFEAGFSEHLSEVEAITANGEAPNFVNTIEALERSGQLLTRVAEVFFNKTSADTSPVLQGIEAEIAPKLSAHQDSITLNPDLYARIKAVYDGLASATLNEEQKYIASRYYLDATLDGAGLSAEDRETLSGYNQRLATLTTVFDQNLVNDTNALSVIVDDVAELEGVDEGTISAYQKAAEAKHLDGKYLIDLILPTGQPALSELEDRQLRRRIEIASLARGTRGGDYDNRETVLEIVRLRATRAQLLGFESHAAAIIAGETAKTPGAVSELLNRLAHIAAKNARAEAEELQHQIVAEGHDFELQSYDWAYYAEKTRAAKYNVDTSKFRPYFELESVLQKGVFFAAEELYGLSFAERKDLVGYHPDVRVFEVSRDGTPFGLYLLDVYTRDSKRGGAWMNPIVSQSELLDSPPVIVNNLNVPKPAEGQATLLTYDEVNTLFHEFGHTLHGLLSQVAYPKGSGTNVYRDFVEFPSQVNEMWMLWPEVLANYAKHYETGEPVPQAWVDALNASETFNEGFATSEYLAAAILDQSWHGLSPEEAAAITDVAAFEAAALKQAGLDFHAVPTRYSTGYFAHTFAGGYDAGYYSYIWSEVLDADTVEWFKEHGGLKRENGERFAEYVLSIGGSKDPLDAYREFRGRAAKIEPLLKRRGLL
ncbi:MAG: M3 family metallopeptidase [Microbacteriaceae bacterium]